MRGPGVFALCVSSSYFPNGCADVPGAKGATYTFFSFYTALSSLRCTWWANKLLFDQMGGLMGVWVEGRDSWILKLERVSLQLARLLTFSSGWILLPAHVEHESGHACSLHLEDACDAQAFPKPRLSKLAN